MYRFKKGPVSDEEFLSVGTKEIGTYRDFQDFVEHDIWRDMEVKNEILEERIGWDDALV